MTLQLIQGHARPIDDPRGFHAREARRERLQLQLSGMPSPTIVRVAADQFYPTPAALADLAVTWLEPKPGERLLEPSAGAAALIDAVHRRTPAAEIVAVEQSEQLAGLLRNQGASVHCADFLRVEPAQLGRFDGVIMNPPFRMGADVAHVRHALRFLRPGGRLVAICADGPRQQTKLRPLAEASGGRWEPLPDASFAESGTMVRTALVLITACA